MVAESLGSIVLHVDVSEFRKGFQALQFAVAETNAAVGWARLEKRIKVEYGVQLWLMSRALGRAEWLAKF